MSNNKYNGTPIIIMIGKWLEKFGFNVGQRYQVNCHEGKLVITIEISVEFSNAKWKDNVYWQPWYNKYRGRRFVPCIEYLMYVDTL